MIKDSNSVKIDFQQLEKIIYNEFFDDSEKSDCPSCKHDLQNLPEVSQNLIRRLRRMCIKRNLNIGQELLRIP